MANGRRIALGITAAVALAALALALALPRLVDPERLKRLARDKAQAAWGRELAIGDLSLTLWPLPALHAGEVSLANPPWARSKQLVTAESVDARLALLPLLVGKVRVKSLDLDGVRLNLETNADGTKSWDLFTAGDRRPTSAGEADWGDLATFTIRNADVTHRAKGAAPAAWRIDGATIEARSGLRDVRVEADVQRNRRHLTLKATLADLSRLGREGATTEGTADFDWGKSQLALSGRLPIDAAMKGYALTADLKAESIHEMAAFFGSNTLATAQVAAHLTAREADGKTEIGEATLSFGKHTITGKGDFTRAGSKTVVNGRLETNRLEWEKALADLGQPPLPPLGPEELFHDNPLAWPLVVALEGSEGVVDLKLGSFVLRNGIEMKNVKARASFAGDRLNVSPYSMDLLGGSATGSVVFEGRKKAVRVTFDATNLLLERWFHERGSKIPFTGGPMKIKATLATSGDSMKDLAASINGPVSIRMGRGVWASEKAGHAEDVMASAFSEKNSASIDFECAGAALPFTAGRASAQSIVGARSTVSNLLTSGYVDFRAETLDLRGRVKPRSGTVGLAAIAGDIQISGKLRAPHAHLDPVSTPAAIVRGAAAIVTLGLSAKGTAEAHAESARKDDPCESVFSR